MPGVRSIAMITELELLYSFPKKWERGHWGTFLYFFYYS